MKNKLIIRNAKITNENKEFVGDIVIEDSFISEISNQSISGTFDEELDASNLLIIPAFPFKVLFTAFFATWITFTYV